MTASTPAPVRHDWTVDEVLALHNQPLLGLLHTAQTIHRANHPPDAVQLSTLLSVKTGGCPEDCAYCPQSSHHDTTVGAERMLSVDEVLSKARAAREAGASRFCMGAAWREVKEGPAFDRVIDMVRGVKSMGLEACCTLGMLSEEQAHKLKDAGLDYYNHNLDTSKEFYGKIITTRTYEDRLKTLQNVRSAGVHVCAGGIIGMGETLRERCAMLVILSTLDPHPESVPINALVAVEGTPLENQPPIDPLELVRIIAAARIVLPQSQIRLSAGRTSLSRESQILCLVAGANSIFYGEKLLTTPNPEADADRALLRDVGLKTIEAHH